MRLPRYTPDSRALACVCNDQHGPQAGGGNALEPLTLVISQDNSGRLTCDLSYNGKAAVM